MRLFWIILPRTLLSSWLKWGNYWISKQTWCQGECRRSSIIPIHAQRCSGRLAASISQTAAPLSEPPATGHIIAHLQARNGDWVFFMREKERACVGEQPLKMDSLLSKHHKRNIVQGNARTTGAVFLKVFDETHTEKEKRGMAARSLLTLPGEVCSKIKKL